MTDTPGDNEIQAAVSSRVHPHAELMSNIAAAIDEYMAGQPVDDGWAPPERDSLLAIRHWRDENRTLAERGLLGDQEERHRRDVDRVLVELDYVTGELSDLEDREARPDG